METLVAYATRMGSTCETARFIADTLRDCGLSIQLQPAADVTSLQPESAVILVAALYVGRLHKDARAFLSRYGDALEHCRVALFVPGPVDREEKSMIGAIGQLTKELKHYPWLKPAACYIIGGVWNPASLPFPWKVLLRKVPASDARDWDGIRARVREVAGAWQSLQPA